MRHHLRGLLLRRRLRRLLLLSKNLTADFVN